MRISVLAIGATAATMKAIYAFKSYHIFGKLLDNEDKSVSFKSMEFYDIYGHDEILGTVGNFIDAGELPNMLFHGPAGTGKTTAAV